MLSWPTDGAPAPLRFREETVGPMRVCNSFKDDIKARVALSSVVARRVQLKRTGPRQFLGLCPFHKEKTPSFHVYEDEDPHYHCYGCGAHGDVFSFVMETEGLGFPEALEQLADEAGLEVPKPSAEERRREETRIALYEVMEAACRWFEQRLRAPDGAEALAYLTSRGLDEATMRAFRLGFAPDRGAADGLARAVAAIGGSPAQLLEAGLYRAPDDGRAPYPFFRNRVMFPILDRKGRPIAFGGRYLGDHKAAGTGKYMNSPDTPLFDKGRTLYNVDKARPAAFDGAPLIVAEGYMDVIALAQGGFRASVAPLGTALSEDQIDALWRLSDAPILCFDGDAAGRAAAAKAAERALKPIKPGKTLRFAFMPEGEDPDSLSRAQGSGALGVLFDAAAPLEDQLWRSLRGTGPLSGVDARARLEQAILRLAGDVGDAIVARHLRDALKARMWDELRAARPSRGPARPRGRDRDSWEPSMGARIAPLRRGCDRVVQRQVLALLAGHPALLSEFEDALAGIAFDPDLDKVRASLQNAASEPGDLDSASLRDHFSAQWDAEMWASLRDPALLRLVPQARADGSLDEARGVLSEIVDEHARQRFRSDMRDAARHAARGDTAREEKFLALTAAIERPARGPSEDG